MSMPVPDLDELVAWRVEGDATGPQPARFLDDAGHAKG